jgi:hypothetical protein
MISEDTESEIESEAHSLQTFFIILLGVYLHPTQALISVFWAPDNVIFTRVNDVTVYFIRNAIFGHVGIIHQSDRCVYAF